METTITGQVISPRYYQIAEDYIESKQAMEPLALALGIGPIKGFDVIKSRSPFTITGSSNSEGISGFSTLNPTNNNKLAVNNIAGIASNVYITPSGILGIAPDVLTFPDINQDTSKLQVVAVKATLIHPGQKPILTPPTIVNFTAEDVSDMRLRGLAPNPNIIHSSSLTEILTSLASVGFNIDPGTEVLIGLYIINVTENEFEMYPELYEELLDQWQYNYSFIPYGYNWPSSLQNSFGEKLRNLTMYNDVLRLKDMGFYDLVISTQAQLEDMLNSPSWEGARSVAIIAPQTNVSYKVSADRGILIPNTVKVIVGYNQPIIEVITTDSDAKGLSYETPLVLITSQGHINIRGDKSELVGRKIQGITINSVNAIPFSGLFNLVDCVGLNGSCIAEQCYLMNNVSGHTQFGSGSEFIQCSNMYNCRVNDSDSERGPSLINCFNVYGDTFDGMLPEDLRIRQQGTNLYFGSKAIQLEP